MVIRHLKHFVANVLLIYRRNWCHLMFVRKLSFFFFDKEGEIVGHMSFPKLQKSLIILLYCFKVESERLQRVIESGKDRYARTLNLQAQMDERELQQVVDDKRKFLKTAVEYYIKTLQTGVGWKGCMLNSCKLNNCSHSSPLPINSDHDDDDNSNKPMSRPLQRKWGCLNWLTWTLSPCVTKAYK